MKFNAQKLPIFALAGGLAIMQLMGQSARAFSDLMESKGIPMSQGL